MKKPQSSDHLPQSSDVFPKEISDKSQKQIVQKQRLNRKLQEKIIIPEIKEKQIPKKVESQKTL